MKRLAFINLALILYLAGLLSAIRLGIEVGGAIVLGALFIILCLYLIQLYISFKVGNLFSLKVLSYTLGALVIAEIFVQGFSISIDKSLLSIPAFYQFHALIGFILLGLFIGHSIVWIRKIERKNLRLLLLTGFGVFCFLSLIGFLSFARIIPGSVRLAYYGFVFLTFFYFLYFLVSFFLVNHQNKSENRIGLLISSLMVLYWVLRWQFPSLIPQGFYKIIFNMGIVTIVIFPCSILLVKKIPFLTAFILYAILSNLYFLAYAREFKYIVDVGGAECIGYDKAIDYPVVMAPGISVEKLFKAPTADEITDIRKEWHGKDFTPKRVNVEHSERKTNGDSVKVVSHYVNGQKHYGIIRIPSGIDTRKAPILLGLQGGGADIDVLESTSLFRISSGMCREVLNNYITISACFRGDIIRGNGFCFRAEGYTGDVWLGAAEDAVSFLEVVKAMYGKGDSTRVLAMGVSRGATVALIVGALTEKLDYIISISTHTDFLNEEAFKNERVGSDYPRIFFTPKTSPTNIRKRMIASSPYYFAEYLPYFEIHQGTEDFLTTAQHTKRLEHRLKETGRSERTFKIYLYEGKGHGFDDDNIVCRSLYAFSNK